MQTVYIAATVKALCKRDGIPVSLLLEKCNLTKSFIYDLEKRNASPSCDKLTRIADYFDVSLDYLVGRTEEPKMNKGDGKG